MTDNEYVTGELRKALGDGAVYLKARGDSGGGSR